MAKLNVVITEKEADWQIFGLAPFVVIAAEPNQHLFSAILDDLRIISCSESHGCPLS